MKKIITLSALLFISAGKFRAQTADSLAGFDYDHLSGHTGQMKDPKLKADYISNVRRSYIKRKYSLFQDTYFPYAKTDSTAGCGNLDFENGSMAGWALTGDFQLMSGIGTDPYGCFPVVCPGGNYSLRLNDDNTSSSKVNFGATASKTIAITSSNATIKVNFAGCFEDFPHPINATSFLKIEFFDQFNNAIPSSSISCYYINPGGGFIAPPGIVSFTSAVMGYNIGNQPYPVSFVPWQAQTFNLSSYTGQNVKIKLTANWCMYNYDWTYAYFDVCCSSSCVTPPMQSCATGINETAGPVNISLTPNPFSTALTISGKDIPSGALFVLYNSLGQELVRKRIEQDVNPVQFGELPSGVYLYSLTYENQLIKMGKLIRE